VFLGDRGGVLDMDQQRGQPRVVHPERHPQLRRLVQLAAAAAVRVGGAHRQVHPQARTAHRDRVQRGGQCGPLPAGEQQLVVVVHDHQQPGRRRGVDRQPPVARLR
jgi:hypothetical protein